jgi:hypothetical protein
MLFCLYLDTRTRDDHGPLIKNIRLNIFLFMTIFSEF